MVQQLARERALADAERQTAIVVAVLTVTTDPIAVQQAITTTGEPVAARVGVHGLAGDVGAGRARADDVRLAAEQSQPVVVDVPGGLSYLEPVDVGLPQAAVVEVFIPAAELTAGVTEAWLALAAVGIGLVGVSVLIGDRLAGQVVGSARELASAASSLGDGDLAVRVHPTGPRELAEAGAAFNTMADRLAALLATERELIADLSHRLRTPLTVLRLEAETAVASARSGVASERSSEASDAAGFAASDAAGVAERDLGRVRAAIDALEREIDDLIRTARLPAVASGEAPVAPRCDAAEVTRERMSFWAAVADDQGRPCTVRVVDSAAPVPVPRADLAAALDALLGNAFRYTPQGTALEVVVSRRDGYVTLRVEDAGPGIPDPERALRRGASDAGSTGLGLDIVRQVAVAGGGAVSIDRGHLGGTSVVLLFADADVRDSAAWSGRLRRAVRSRKSSLDLN